MTHPVFSVLLLLLLAPAVGGDDARLDHIELAQLTIHQRIVIRIPRVPRMLGGNQRSEPETLRWAEKKGPKCVPAATLAAALVSEEDRVDLLLIDGTRLRARLEDHCPALDFYSGLYLRQTEDGLVCAERDSIRARSGSVCRIDGFKRLVLKRRDTPLP